MVLENSPAQHAARLRRAGLARRGVIAAGVLQIAALFTPAAHVRLLGDISFFRLPTAGAVLLGLGLLTLGLTLHPGRWWRWLPGLASAAVLAISYWRIVYSPSATFADPLLRHAVHPSWGFVPIGAAVAIGLLAVAGLRADHPSLIVGERDSVPGPD
ncbi:MAG: hypothetical protein ABJE47_05780 [bacterium]